MDLLDVFRPNIARLRERKDREGLVRALDYRKDATFVIARQTVFHDAAHPSRIVLPIVPRR